MKSIKDNISNTIIIKNSKFICHLYKVDDIEEINNYLELINKEYHDATHNCYAYICGPSKKCSDNGEPGGTAGMPMLNVLEMNELDHVLAVVTRYFGGTKLGAGGLVRAYTGSVTEALDKTSIIELSRGKLIKIEFTYDNIKTVDHILKDIEVIDKIFDTNITYTIKIKDNSSILDELSSKIITYSIIKEILI